MVSHVSISKEELENLQAQTVREGSALPTTMGHDWAPGASQAGSVFFAHSQVSFQPGQISRLWI